MVLLTCCPPIFHLVCKWYVIYVLLKLSPIYDVKPSANEKSGFSDKGLCRIKVKTHNSDNVHALDMSPVDQLYTVQ